MVVIVIKKILAQSEDQMSKRILAIANCRVSSDEQLLNNSIARQQASVLAAADRLGAEIIKTWSGSVSSKVGTNIKRKDLLAMLDCAKRNPSIKFAIFDEYDRYMRSVNEGPYFEVKFQQLGVKVWYASESDTFNGDDAMAKFMRSMSAFKAEGSNEERQRKSISGQTTALKAGLYPFSPKPGYKGGSITGIPEIHPVRGPALRTVLLRVVTKQVTPTQGLIELNKSEYANERAHLKMDKFRKIATDPFYAGIVEIKKQINIRNENGRHDPLITLEQHYELVRIFENKKKTQQGPRKNGNPEYPLSNLITCSLCVNKSSAPRYVGYPHSNGKNSALVYHKYRCRSCQRYLPREILHPKVEEQFKNNPITEEGMSNFLKALDIVWKQREAQAHQDVVRTKQKINSLNDSIHTQAMAAIEPDNSLIKQEIFSNIAKSKSEIQVLEDELSKLTQKSDTDKEQFLRFAFDFANNMGSQFLQISKENRLRCKQIIFPAGFYLDANNKVYTPEISPLITLQTKKKDTEVSEISHLVRVKRLKLSTSSLARKRSIN
jgi:DNA invertase Pin-like site-specific DNA recombinase